MQPEDSSVTPVQGAPARSSSPTRHRSPPAKRRRTSSAPYPTASSPTNAFSRGESPDALSIPQVNPSQASTASKWFRKPSVVWYRGHDLRVDDHPALLAAAQRGGPVVPLFVWDPDDAFGSDLGTVKQWWLRESLRHLQRDLHRLGVQLYTRTGYSTSELRKFLKDTGADAIFWNRCYEPDLLSRDEELRDELAHEGLTAESFKAELLVEPWELTNTEVSPCYDTFHEYMRKWMRLSPPPQPFPCPSRLQPITHEVKSTGIEKLGFNISPDVHERMSKVWAPGSKQAKVQLEKFLREVFPAFGDGRCRRHFEGTSRLSPHIRFGEISPRRMYHSTRLRVSQWDQYCATYPAPNIRSIPRNGASGKPAQSDGTVKEREGKAASIPQNGSIGGKKNQEQNGNAFSNENLGLVFPETSKGAKSQANIPEGSSTADPHGKSTPSLRRRVPQTAGIKKVGLPHISLSARAFLKNLCLRDFSYHVLFHNPDFNAKPLIPEFSCFPWAEDNGTFESWLHGRTGYPIVDAAMRELHETGWIHNGMRFLLACFLTKYLLLPWSRGLKEFYGLLIDGDHSANALGWQWTAGSNTDAFPLSCLVNPVKIASRHDPSGSYIRKWLPELAKLPNKFVHEPWKAAPEDLKSWGVELGKSYPFRVVQVNEARNRAREAMRTMKQIFSGSQVLRGIYNGKDEDIIKEWPETNPEILPEEDSSSSSGKMSLLPSLWAILQCDQAPTYLSGTTTGNDTLIAIDTASLTEGALAVPLDEQHESIEHALISAHEQVSVVESVPPADRSLDVSSFGHVTGAAPSPVIQSDEDGSSLGADNLDHRLKYGSDENEFQEDDKMGLQPGTEVQVTERDGLENSHSMQRTSEGLSTVSFPETTKGVAAPVRHLSAGQQASYSQPPQAHFHHFQQLQQLQQVHQLQQYHLQQQQQSLQPLPQNSHSQPLGNIQAQGPARQQQQHAHMHGAMENMSGSGAASGTIQGGSTPSVPMTGTAVLMGSVTGTPDGAINPSFPTDNATAVYGHQFGMNQFYGMSPVLPVMGPHGVATPDRIEGGGPSQTAQPKVAMPGMLPLGYGVYGSGMFDPNVLGNTFSPGSASFPGLSVSSQQQSAAMQTAYGLHPHAMYFSGPPGMEVLQNQANGNSQHPPSASIPQSRLGSQVPSLPGGNVTAAAAAAAVAAGGREVAINAASDSRNRHVVSVKRGTPGSQGRGSESLRQGQNQSTGKEKTKSGAHRNGINQQHKPNHGRVGPKQSSKAKGSGRSRKGSGSGPQGRNRTDGKGNTSPRVRDGDSTARNSSRGNDDRMQNQSAQTTSLKTRQEILASVLEKEDHEYHEFAQYLSITYELTGNTDRATSKDYVRLCNLKDDYHKKCKSEKDKLKIYRIKAFFSQILKLEVTGEWDRHNHGGVRGPYVYGIRIRKPIESSQAAQS